MINKNQIMNGNNPFTPVQVFAIDQAIQDALNPLILRANVFFGAFNAQSAACNAQFAAVNAQFAAVNAHLNDHKVQLNEV
jgi:hypothetical protein